MSARDQATEWSYRAAWRLVRTLPEPVAAAAFRAGADRAVRKRGGGVRRLEANLRQVVGDLSDDLLRDAMRSYARYWLEAFRLPSRTLEARRAGFVLHGNEIIQANCAAGRGTILALPHGGNWDAAGAMVAAEGLPITTVAERLKPEGVYRRFLAFRESLGMEILPLTGGDRPTLDVLAERLAAGTVVPLLADRDFSARGVEVEFFGRRTKMPAGPAILAIRTGAPIHCVDMWYEESGPKGRIGPPLEVPTEGALDVRVRLLTQRMADRLAEGIARHPRDWHMLARMFATAPAAEPAPASLDGA